MKRFKDILCVVDASGACRSTIEHAVTLAENNQARLMVVEVSERITADMLMRQGGHISADLQAAIESMHADDIESLVEPYRKRIDIRTKVLKGTAFLEIIREVLRNGHDLVIKTAEHQDWLDRLFTSNDMHLLRKCPCPVWLDTQQAPKAYRRILVAVDVDDSCPPQELKTRHLLNVQSMEMAASLALSEFAELHVAYIWMAIGESAMRGAFLRMPEDQVAAYVEKVRRHQEDRLNALMREVTDKLGRDALDQLQPQTHLVKGLARREIPALAKWLEADLVVMGTVARTGVPGFIVGNTAETILNQLDRSVLAIKPLGFVTPVGLDD